MSMIDSRRARILLVTRNLPPLVGGMERLNWHMAEELAKGAHVRIVGPEGSAMLAPAGVEVREAPLKPLWKFLWCARALARREAKIWRPDIVLAGSGLTAPIVRSAASACGARTAVYVHGLDVAVRHLAYRAIWVPAIQRVDRVIANSHATAMLCREIGVRADRIGVVHPGVDLPDESSPGPKKENGEGACAQAAACEDVLHEAHLSSANPSVVVPAWPAGLGQESSFADLQAAEFRAQHNLGSGPILLSVGRLSERKGLREFVTHALPHIVTAHPDVFLLIVGDAPRQALHAQSQTPDSIRAAAREAGVVDHLLFLGTITDYSELQTVYRAANVHVFPVREIPGDPEGFGMVAVEAAAHGLPTVAFATGGVTDAVAEGQSGHLVAAADYTGFANRVLETLMERELLRIRCIDFARQFDWGDFGAQIRNELLLSNKHLSPHRETG